MPQNDRRAERPPGGYRRLCRRRRARARGFRSRRRHGCARNAASSASSAIPTPRRSPRSACTPCSTAARKRPASSPSTARASIPSAAWAWSATTSPAPRRSSACRARRRSATSAIRPPAATILRNVQPLFAELDAGGLAVAHNGNLTNGLTLRRELIREGAICQSTSDTEVVLLLTARSRRTRIIDRFIDALDPDRGRLCAGRADQQEADRRPRSARHPPAGARRARRLPDPVLGDLRARHHRRQVRARHRERRGDRHRRRAA